jgi:DNA invertase Pin-like site-specific DNA recombinase
MSPRPQRRRCAIYTRKSSAEGLDQAFNSLDAQREACEAYIRSQRHEGWQLLATRYDDGGFSGGTLERPALQRLLAEIERGAVDTVVVYKVDRLTRALSDFARLVEIFDRQNVSFVSVTQAFNTTSSMGRLTLNVLLSFAQFEREVTGERIRDKFAASRAKGLWMGGFVPLGYDLKERQLIVNEEEAAAVRHIFERYCVLRCVRLLKSELDAAGIRSKRRGSASGRMSGGTAFSRGALYALLQNRLYLGEAVHKGKAYPGQHAAILESALWDRAQATLKDNRVAQKHGLRAKEPSLLAGLLFDAAGRRMTPVHTQRRGRRYRYYVASGSTPLRLPAHELEALVLERLAPILTISASANQSPTQIDRGADGAEAGAGHIDAARSGSAAIHRSALLKLVQRITVEQDRLLIRLDEHGNTAGSHCDAADETGSDEASLSLDPLQLTVPYRVQSCRGEIRLLSADGGEPSVRSPNHALVKAVARGFAWRRKIVDERLLIGNIAKQVGCADRYVSQMLRLGFLAPDIVCAILEGREPVDLTLDRLAEGVPFSWAEQRQRYGFAGA